MLQLQSASGPFSWTGVTSAILSTFAYAFYVILSHSMGKRYSPWTLVFYGYTIAGIFWCTVQNPVETGNVLFNRGLWKWAFFFSLVSTLIPFILFLNGLRRISPTGATIASTTETISATGFAYLTLGESLTTGQLIGAALIVSSIIILAVKKGQSAPEPTRISDASTR